MLPKVHKHPNPEYIAAMREIRKSNAAQPHKDKRKKRESNRLRKEIQDDRDSA